MKKFIENYLLMIIGVILGGWAMYLYDNIIDRILIGIMILSIITVTLTDISEAKQR